MAYIKNVSTRFRRWVFACALCFAALLPYGAQADFELPPGPFLFTTTTLNGEEDDAELSSENSTVEIAASSEEEAYFTRLYICSLFADECDGSSYIKRFDINATTTSFVRVWDGTDADGTAVPEDEYQIVIRFYRYEVQEEAFEETVPWRVEVVSTEDDESENEEEESPEPPSLPSVGISLNGNFVDTSLSSTSPVTIVATSSVEVYFTNIFVCSEDAELCGLDAHTAVFTVHATSTEVFRVWDGTASSTASSSPGTYTVLVHYYAYEISPNLLTATTSLSITVLEEDEVDEEEENESDPPVHTLITQATFPGNRNVGAVVWNKEGSPYVVEGVVNLGHGSITIEPGTVVKFKEDATLTAHAQFPVSINGTVEEPVIFTSFKDDSVGGDTNDDGSTTTPEPGDWGYASFGGGGTNSDMQIEYLQVRYGGGVSVDDLRGSFAPSLYITYWWYNGNPGRGYTLENIQVSHSADVGLALSIGRNNGVSVSGSSFHDNERFGVYKVFSSKTFKGRDDTGGLDLSGNWWGSDTGPYHSSLNPEGLGDEIGVGAHGSSGTKYPTLSDWLSSDPFGLPVYEECCSSVLFLPGIKGSRLYMEGADGEEQLWEPNEFFDDNDVRNLLLNTDGDSINTIYAKEDDVLDSVGPFVDLEVGGFLDIELGKSDYYAALIADMDNLVSNGTITAFKSAAYDWRLSLDDIVDNGYQDGEKIFYNLATSTPYIEQTLRYLAQTSQTGKVTIVAHSNGGLVAKKLIERLGSTASEQLIDEIVMIGVPQSGAPQAMGALLYGYREGLPEIFPVVVNKETARGLAENSPMAYHLLPSQAYFDSVKDIDHPVGLFSGTRLYEKERDAYGSLIGNWNELAAFLRADEDGRLKPPASDTNSANVLNPSLLSYAKQTHDALDVWTPPSGITLHQVAGWGVDTIAGIEFYDVVAPGSGETIPLYKPILVEDGDGVVPVPSALMTSTSTENVKRWWFDLAKYSEEFTKREHAQLFEVPDLRLFLKQVIQNETEYPNSILTTQPANNELSKKLRFFLHSPLSLTVLDENGNTVGEYDEFGDVKYITVPAGTTYTLNLTGYDTGTFTLEIEELAGGTAIASSTLVNIPSTASTTATLTIGDSLASASTLSVDIDGDGAVDTELAPQAGEMVFYQEPETEETAETEPPVPTPTPTGGGPLWNTPAPTPQVLGASTTTEGASAASTTKASTSKSLEPAPVIEPQHEVSTKQTPKEKSNISAPVNETSTANNAPQNESVTQTAIVLSSASQQSWFETVLSSLKRGIMNVWKIIWRR